MNLYVMRHGTTVWNEKHISQGRSNNRLSQTGKQLAQQSAQKYKDTKFDIIIVSPLMRTLQTANIMNKYHNVKKIMDARLLEIDQGVFTGQKIAELSSELIEQRVKRDPKCGIESAEDIFARTKNFLDNIKKEYPYENILVVTHNWIASLLEILILNQTEKFNDYNMWSQFGNAQVKHFVL